MKEIKFCMNGKMDLYWNDEVYKTDIQELNAKYISISMPIANGKLLPLAKGDLLELVYYEDLSLYKFFVKVIDRYFDGIVHQIFIEYPKTWTKIQRRSYVRVSTIEYISIISIDDLKEASPEKEPEFQKALLLDLSGGGVRIKASKLLDNNQKLIIYINNEIVNLKIPGKVVRIEKDDDGRYIYGIIFEEINDALRESIIQYVFSLMRKQIRQE